MGTADARDGFVDQGGMFEAPPPTMDAKLDATKTADTADAGRDAVFLDQGGMFEAPPPRLDAVIAKKD